MLLIVLMTVLQVLSTNVKVEYPPLILLGPGDLTTGIHSAHALEIALYSPGQVARKVERCS